MSEFIGSYDGDDTFIDSGEDDILFSGDPDFDRDTDARLLADGDYGAVKRRVKARQTKRAKLLETILMPFTRAAVAPASPGTFTVEPDRDCRILDLRVIGTVAATGVEDPGITITGFNAGGASFFNSGGAFVAAHVHPRDRRPGCYNCNLKKLVRASTTITLTVANVTAAAISVDGSILVRAKVTG